MTTKNRILCALLGAGAVSLTFLLITWVPGALTWLLGVGGSVLFLVSLAIPGPTYMKQPPWHSVTILDRGHMTPAEVHEMLGIWLPAQIEHLQARDAQWTVARHVPQWRADHVVQVLEYRGVVAERRFEPLSALQWVGVHIFPVLLGVGLTLPLLAVIGFGTFGSNWLTALLLFAVWGAVAMAVRGALERWAIHRVVWEPELTPDGTRFVER